MAVQEIKVFPGFPFVPRRLQYSDLLPLKVCLEPRVVSITEDVRPKSIQGIFCNFPHLIHIVRDNDVTLKGKYLAVFEFRKASRPPCRNQTPSLRYRWRHTDRRYSFPRSSPLNRGFALRPRKPDWRIWFLIRSGEDFEVIIIEIFSVIRKGAGF